MPRRPLRRLLVWAAGAGILLPTLALAGPPAAASSSVIIDVVTDCPASTPGQSLVDAMQAAQDGNSGGECTGLGALAAEPYILNLDPAQGPYVLTAPNNYVDGPNGLPDVTGTVTVQSTSTTPAVIERSTASGTAAFRFFHVSARQVDNASGSVVPGVPGVSAEGSLTLDYIDLENGLAQGGVGGTHDIIGGGGGGLGAGGAIFSHGGSVTVTDSTIADSAADGGNGTAYLTGINAYAGGGGGMGGSGGTGYASGSGGGGGGTEGDGGDGSSASGGLGGGPNGGGTFVSNYGGPGGYNGGGQGGQIGSVGGFGGGGGGAALSVAGDGGFGGGGGAGGWLGGNGGFGGGGGAALTTGGAGSGGFGGGDGANSVGGGGAGMGGGIFALGGSLTLNGDTFASDTTQGGAAGGTGAGAGQADGGAVFVDAADNGPTAYSGSNLTFSGDSAATSGPDVAVHGTVAVSVTPASLPGAAVGTSYSQTLGASGGTQPYTWQVSQGTLPAGLTLTSSGVLSGTPTAAGVSNFTVQVSDSSQPALTVSQAYALTVGPSSTPLTIATTTMTPGTVGTAYTATPIDVSGGTSPYTWSVVDGSLPAGMALNSVTGFVYGTPTQAENSSFVVEVTDSDGHSAYQTLAIGVVPAGSFSLTTGATLPDGVVDVPYSTTLSAANGVAPLTWSVVSGSLPAGLSLDPSTGVISGTPTAAGSSSFAVLLESSSIVGQSGGGDFTLDIASQPPESVTVGSSAGYVAVDGSTTVSGEVYTSTGTVSGAQVDLTLSGDSGGSISPSATTNSSGDYQATLTAPPNAGIVTVSATVYGTTYSAQSVVLVTPVGVTTSPASALASGGQCAMAKTGQVYEAGCGDGILEVSNYAAGSPETVSASGTAQYYFDAAVSNDTGFTEAAIVACGASSGDLMQWWDPATSLWQDVSPGASYDNSCLTFIAKSSTTPSLSDLFGTPFALTAPAAFVGGGGGGGGALLGPPPVISAISPAGGPAAGGTTVAITGSGFSGAGAVDFGGTAAQSFSIQSDGEITAVSPAGSGTVDVTVTTPAGTTALVAADRFTYAPAAAAPASFSDVPAGSWEAASVALLARDGIVSGFPDGTFRPNEPVTRAQFVKMLDLALGLKLTGGGTAFGDVAPSAWYAPYVAAAVQDGLVQGVTPTSFDPGGDLSRQELAVLLTRALSLAGTAPLHFTDAALIAPWALPGVAAAVAAGYMNGFPGGTFQPQSPTTRAQAARVLAEIVSGQKPR